MDAVALTSTGALYVFENDGNGQFTTSVAATVPNGSAVHLVVADLDADGFDDLLTTDYSKSPVRVFMNFGGKLYPLEDASSTPFAYAPIIGDFTGDGFPDLAGLGGYTSDFELRPGLGDGKFGDPVVGVLPCPDVDCSTFTPGVADFNLDGVDDVAVSDSLADRFLVYLSADGTPFAEVVDLAHGKDYYFGITVADVNGDGRQDVAGLANGELIVYTSTGNGGFSEPSITRVMTDSSSVNPTDTLRIDDLDTDGFADVLYAEGDSFRGEIFVAFGDGSGSFSTPEVVVPIGGTRFSIGSWNADQQDDLFYETPVDIGSPGKPPTVSLSCPLQG